MTTRRRQLRKRAKVSKRTSARPSSRRNQPAYKREALRIAVARRIRLTLRRVFWGSLLGLFLFIMGSAGWFVYTGGIGRFFDERWTDFLIFTAKRGLRVEEIFLEGQHYASSDEILTTLDVQRGEPILGIPIESIKQRIELLSWVKYAAIERQLPNVLHVRIIENTPAALWQYDKKLYVISPEGEVVEDTNIKPFSKLPILVGEDAPENAAALLAMVDSEEMLKPYFTSAIRVGGRRWNVRTASGIEIKLPEEGQDAAWKRLAILQKETKVLDTRIASVDLRLPDKITIGRR